MATNSSRSSNSAVAVIFLHGAGLDGQGKLRSAISCLPIETLEFRTFRQAAAELEICLVTPTAGEIAYTPALGELVPAWFNRSSDYHRLGREDPFEDVCGLDNSLSSIRQHLVDLEQSYQVIFVGGVSMGGELALHLLSENQLPKAVAGIFSISSMICLYDDDDDDDDDDYITYTITT